MQLFTQACVTDVLAVKPGNAGCLSGARGMTAYDFLMSAAVCAPPLCEPGVALGRRILNTVAARRAAVRKNTNLGIVLLCAPLVQTALAAGGGPAPFRRRLEVVLEQTTVADAERVYEAIRMAGAGGLGRVLRQDVVRAPTVSLREAMALAAERDTIAGEYASAYSMIFGVALPRYLELRRRWGYNSATATGLYLFLLSACPDSLVARKEGKEEARALSAKAGLLANEYLSSDTPDQFADQLKRLDAQLKERGINPGTTADITVSCVFLAEILKLETMRAM